MPLAFSQMPSVIPGFSIIVDSGVRGVKRAGLGRTKKQTEPLPYRLFPGSGTLLIYYTRSLERIDRRFQFGYEFKKLKTDEWLRVVGAGCGGNLKTPLIHQR